MLSENKPYEWQPAPDPVPSLADDTLHIWLWSQQQSKTVGDSLRPSLSRRENERAAKFYTDDLRNRYIVRWGVVRHILSKYLPTAPQDFTFQYGERGKPYLDNTPLHFNISHSEDYAIMGVSGTQQLGIDIEYMQPLPDMRLVAKHHFSPTEQADLFSLPDADQLTGFYNCWTRKEAFIKVDGRGLAVPLDSFDVTLKPDDPPRVKRIGDDTDINGWTLHALPVPENYKAAFATQQPIAQIKRWLFTSE